MNDQRTTASAIQDITSSILCLAGRLQAARTVNPAHAVSIMSLIANRYRQAVIQTPDHYLIAELPGNASLWKAMAVDGYVDEKLYPRLKSTITRAVQSVFPDISRFAEGIDTTLMAASKLRREYDAISAEIQFAVDTGRVTRHVDAPLNGLREALVSGGVHPRRLGPIAYEAIHDVVFYHLLSKEDGEDFIEHSIDDATESLDRAVMTFGDGGNLAQTAGVTRKNLGVFGARTAPAAKYEALAA
jgi:hypothetical protein|nr:hypothetical protein [Neorhizobium tomejilense]